MRPGCVSLIWRHARFWAFVGSCPPECARPWLPALSSCLVAALEGSGSSTSPRFRQLLRASKVAAWPREMQRELAGLLLAATTLRLPPAPQAEAAPVEAGVGGDGGGGARGLLERWRGRLLWGSIRGKIVRNVPRAFKVRAHMWMGALGRVQAAVVKRPVAKWMGGLGFVALDSNSLAHIPRSRAGQPMRPRAA